MLSSGTSGSNAPLSITLIGKLQQRHHVQQLTWSYGGTLAGVCTITLSGLEGDTLTYDVTVGGPGGLALPPACYGRVGANVVATMSAGGGGIVGKMNLFSELE